MKQIKTLVAVLLLSALTFSAVIAESKTNYEPITLHEEIKPLKLMSFVFTYVWERNGLPAGSSCFTVSFNVNGGTISGIQVVPSSCTGTIGTLNGNTFTPARVIQQPNGNLSLDTEQQTFIQDLICTYQNAQSMEVNPSCIFQ